MDRFPLGYNTYSIRALRWNDLQLIEYASSLKLDAIFLQDSIDPGINDPAHWKAVKDAAARAGLWLGTGGGAVLPKDDSEFDHSVKLLSDGIKRAVGMGSPLVRMLLAGDREHLPPGPPAKHVETMIKVLRVVRNQAVDAGVKFAIENHKELLCWQTRQVIDGAGKEFVGSYLDTGNPVFVMEDPMQTVETLGPVAVMLHLRDSVVYESRGGIAVQWVPLGEGVVDFKAILAKAKEICPPLAVFNKPITGRPPAILPVWDAGIHEEVRRRARVGLRALPRAGQEGRPLRAPHGDRGRARKSRRASDRRAHLPAARAYGTRRGLRQKSPGPGHPLAPVGQASGLSVWGRMISCGGMAAHLFSFALLCSSRIRSRQIAHIDRHQRRSPLLRHRPHMIRAAQAFGLHTIPKRQQREILRVDRQRLLNQPEIGTLPARIPLLRRKPARQIRSTAPDTELLELLHQRVEAVLPEAPRRRHRFIPKRIRRNRQVWISLHL